MPRRPEVPKVSGVSEVLESLKANAPGGGRPAPERLGNLRAGVWRHGINLFPAFRGTGARVKYIEPEMREVLVELPLNWRTHNYFGTIFGGSIYAATDPFYALMLMQGLGPGYVVWDRAASVRYRKPGSGTLYARFELGEEEPRAIRRELAVLENEGSRRSGARISVDRVYGVDLTDAAGEVHATVEKTLYIGLKDGLEDAAAGGRRTERAAEGVRDLESAEKEAS